MSKHDHKHEPHSHVDEQGRLVKCYHECKSQIMSLSFWVMMTLFFPLEHILWEHVPPFSTINHAVSDMANKINGESHDHHDEHDH